MMDRGRMDEEAFYNLADFAEPAVFLLPDGGTLSANVIRDSEYMPVDLGGETVEAMRHTLQGPAHRLRGVTDGARVRLPDPETGGARVWLVVDTRPTAGGDVVCTLAEIG